MAHFAPTSIGFPVNGGYGLNYLLMCSLRQLGRELRTGSTGRGFQPLPHVSLSVSASLLYSVIAFHKGSPVGLYYPQKWGDVKRIKKRG